MSSTSQVEPVARLLAFCGYATAGKDAAAAALCEKRNFVRVSFADPVRQGLYALNPLVRVPRQLGWLARQAVRLLLWLGWPNLALALHGDLVPLQDVVDLLGWDRAKQIKDVRELLQRYGTEAGRDIHGQDCWAKIADAKASAHLAAGDNVVITDLRFPDTELPVVHKYAGTIWRIERPGVGPVNEHVSDKRVAAMPADLVIQNNTPLWEYQQRVLAHWDDVAEPTHDVIPLAEYAPREA